MSRPLVGNSAGAVFFAGRLRYEFFSSLAKNKALELPRHPNRITLFHERRWQTQYNHPVGIEYTTECFHTALHPAQLKVFNSDNSLNADLAEEMLNRNLPPHQIGRAFLLLRFFCTSKRNEEKKWETTLRQGKKIKSNAIDAGSSPA